jgi:hypothetical protein
MNASIRASCSFLVFPSIIESIQLHGGVQQQRGHQFPDLIARRCKRPFIEQVVDLVQVVRVRIVQVGFDDPVASSEVRVLVW